VLLCRICNLDFFRGFNPSKGLFMSLPPVSIPDIALPFAIPHMFHPLFVHFAIALPVLIILFELVNLILKRRVVGVTSFLLIVLLVIVYVGTYLTGVTDAQDAIKTLSAEARDMLSSHKQTGIYLVYGSLVVLILKTINAFVKKRAVNIAFIVILILFTLIAFVEGKKGGQLVYQYGVNVQAVSHAAPSHDATTSQTHEATPADAKPAEHSAAATHEPAKQAPTPKPTLAEDAQKALHKVNETVHKAAAKIQDIVPKPHEAAKQTPEHESAETTKGSADTHEPHTDKPETQEATTQE